MNDIRIITGNSDDFMLSCSIIFITIIYDLNRNIYLHSKYQTHFSVIKH
jgi:hypothetical protein